MSYGDLIDSFVYWSGRMSPDRLPQPFNALLMISGGETLLIGGSLMIYSVMADATFQVGAMEMTFVSVLIFVLNALIFKNTSAPQNLKLPRRKGSVLAPIFGVLCVAVFVFAGVVVYNSSP